MEESLKERILVLAVQEEGKIDVEGIIRAVGEKLLAFIGEVPLAEHQYFSNLQTPNIRRKVLNQFLEDII
ncbi:hypothetical protein LCGC14_1616880 [marine sediment metagenome]|uniref:Uncharacterized protein n=1 Tax=marine sediment metagenome TaxID=412755 RepID=A0A0F9KM61_9ZZZZ